MEEKIICYCNKVSEKKIVNAIKSGSKTLKEIQEKTTACTGNKCLKLNPKERCCSIEILELLQKYGIKDKENCCSGSCSSKK